MPRLDLREVLRTFDLPVGNQPWVAAGSVRFNRTGFDSYVAELKGFFCINRFDYLKWMHEGVIG